MFPNTKEPSAALERKYVVSADNTKTLVGQAGRLNLFGAFLENNHTSDVFLQLFDAATTGAVTLGTTVANFTIRIPASGAVVLDQLRPFLHCVNGLVFAVTSTRTGSSAPGANASVTLYFSQQ